MAKEILPRFAIVVEHEWGTKLEAKAKFDWKE